MKYKLTIFVKNDAITYESDNADEIMEQLEKSKTIESNTEREYTRPATPYERCRNAVYATGNKWAIENFNATH